MSDDSYNLELGRVAEHLATHCVGRANAQTKQTIAEELGYESPGDLRELHNLIDQLVTDYGWPVVSECASPMGYFLAVDRAHKRSGVHKLRRRALAILRRAKRLKLAVTWPGRPLRQRSLLEPPTPDEIRRSVSCPVG